MAFHNILFVCLCFWDMFKMIKSTEFLPTNAEMFILFSLLYMTPLYGYPPYGYAMPGY
jgi:hypothetical protein